MIMRKHILNIILLNSFLLLISCTKNPGIGGQASIIGKILVNNINILGDTIATYDAQEEDVYIIYGNLNNTFDDDTKTSHDGSFEFKFLNPGQYDIFTYSDCADCPNGQDSVVIINTTINSSNEIKDLGTIQIANYL
jgi:hypothetical protein